MRYTDRFHLMQAILMELKAYSGDAAAFDDFLQTIAHLRKQSDIMELFESARFSIKEKFGEKEQQFYRPYRIQFNALFDQLMSHILPSQIQPDQREDIEKLIINFNSRFRGKDYLKGDFDEKLAEFRGVFSRLLNEKDREERSTLRIGN